MSFNAVDIVVLITLLVIASGIIFYIVRSKKQGKKCIGCPYAKQCGGKCCESEKNKE